jgi:hypothetical protein
MRRLLYVTAIGLGVAFVSFLAARRVVLVSQEFRATPFVASVEVTGFRPDGTVGHTEHYLYAMRTDGSWAELHRRQDPEGHWKEIKIICDFAQKRRVTVEGLTDSLTTYPVSQGSIASMKGTMSSCAGGAPSAQGNILGYGVVKVVKDFTVSAQQVSHLERWLAPALGCYELSSTSTLGPPLGPAARTVAQVIAVAEGEPPSSWFSLPANFVERSPSQIFAEYARRFPGASAPPAATGQKLDRAYESSQANPR